MCNHFKQVPAHQRHGIHELITRSPDHFLSRRGSVCLTQCSVPNRTVRTRLRCFLRVPGTLPPGGGGGGWGGPPLGVGRVLQQLKAGTPVCLLHLTQWGFPPPLSPSAACRCISEGVPLVRIGMHGVAIRAQSYISLISTPPWFCRWDGQRSPTVGSYLAHL